MTKLTDEQCDEFRRLPLSFNDMVRSIYEAGKAASDDKADAERLRFLSEILCNSDRTKADKMFDEACYVGEIPTIQEFIAMIDAAMGVKK